MQIEISIGEFLDKISILELKLLKITDESKLINIKREFYYSNPFCTEILETYGDELKSLYLKLSRINGELWVIEDKLRELEAEKRFDEEFIELARSVYFTNDRRSEVKKDINLLTGSEIIEEKSYKNCK
jgi:predicted nuclease with TOPRIM domain